MNIWEEAALSIVSQTNEGESKAPRIFKLPRLHREPLDDESIKYLIVKGGRGGLKTTSFLCHLIEQSYRFKNAAFLCTREISKSIADSVHATLADLIGSMGSGVDKNGIPYSSDDFQIGKQYIINKKTGVRFIFMGLRATGGSTAMAQLNKVKGLYGIKYVFLEEGQDLTENSLNVLMPTVNRKGGAFLEATFGIESDALQDLTECRFITAMNPSKPMDPVIAKFNTLGGTTLHLNMMDIIEDEPVFKDEQLINQMELEKGEYYFDHVWNGAPFHLFAGLPFSHHKIFDDVGDEDIMCLAVSIDPSFKGGDFTSISAIGRRISTGEVVVWGEAFKSAWNMPLGWEGILRFIRKWSPEKVFFEENALGTVPKQYLAREGINGIGFTSVLNKEEKIYKCAAFSKDLISFSSNQCNAVWLQQVLDYNDEAEYDDAPDSLSCVILNTGLIKDRVKW